MSIFSKKDKLEKPARELLDIHYRRMNAIRSQKVKNEHQQEIDCYINLLKPETDLNEVMPGTEMFILACEIRAFILLHYSFDFKNVKIISEDMLAVYNYGKMVKESCNMNYISFIADFFRMLIFIKTQVKNGFSKVFEEYLAFVLPCIQKNDIDAISTEMYFFQDIGDKFSHTLEDRSHLHDFIFSNSNLITAQLIRNMSMHYRLLNAEVDRMLKNSK